MERRGEKRKLPKGMEFQITTPTTITARRIPRRKARETPSSNAPDLPATTSKLSASKPLSHEDIREPEPEPEPNLSLSKPSDDDAHQDLSVFLGIRPLDLKPRPKKKSPNGGGPKSKAELEKDKLKKKKKIPDKQAICLVANDSPSVTLTVPPSLNESKRKKGEIYDGFSHGFTADSLQGCSEIGGKCGKGVFETLGNAGNVNEEQLQELDQQQDSKALWNVLKQYKKELEVSKNEVQSLQEKLRNEKVRVLDMEKQLNKFKSSCSCLARSSRKMSSNSELLLGSQELPASDVERSNRCQALCSNGGKKHLNVEKARRFGCMPCCNDMLMF